jgi:phthiodiolone/phenolphthiodiolone dimycocerosates ketoreductase
MARDIRIGLHYNPVRYFPPQAAIDIAKVIDGCDAVDYLLLYDQLVAWFPQVLWSEQNTPLAALVQDGDSFADPWILAGAISQAVPGLGLSITGDALRRGPAEILQSALTLGRATQGKTIVQIGAGEQKQARPFGHKRIEGLKRMEDIFQIIRKLLGTDGLIDHDGNVWKYERAWIGKEKEFVPEIWAMGGGPKLTEIATKYADGYVSLCPQVYTTPEAYAAEVVRIKDLLEKEGRDPEKFTFALWNVVFLWDDPEEFERLIDNPLLKFQAATVGRLKHSDWRKEGIDTVFPDDWHYALKMLPHAYSDAEAQDIVDRTPDEMVRGFCFKGTPKEVANDLQGFIDAGATAMFPMDYSPYFLGAEGQQHALERQLALCTELRQ